MIVINGFVSDEIKKNLLAGGTHPAARRHANLIIAGGNFSSSGKNLFYRDYVRTESNIGVTFSWDADKQEFLLNGTTNSAGDLRLVSPLKVDWEFGEKYTISVHHVSGTAKLPEGSTGTTYAWSIFSNDAKKYIRSGNLSQDFVEVYSFTGTAFEAEGYIFYLQSWKPGTVFDNYRVKVQIEKGTESTTWEAH